MKFYSGKCLLLTVVINFLFISIAYAAPRFMSFPFTDPNIKIQQGWLYDFPGQLCTSDPYCHYAIDYIKGVVDQSSTWTSFDVLAVADGSAMYLPNGSETWGNYVVTKHTTVGGVDYYTIN